MVYRTLEEQRSQLDIEGAAEPKDLANQLGAVRFSELEPKNRFARFVHRLDLLLKSARGAGRAELAHGIYQYGYGRICCCYPHEYRR